MRLHIKDLINKHKNVPCVVVGSGPSMADFDYKNFKGIVITVGTSIYRLPPSAKNKIDYLVSCNNEFPLIEISSHLNLLNKNKKMTWLMSDTACYNTLWDYNESIFDKLKINYFTYDAVHFNLKPCKENRKCCNFLKIYPERKSLQEQVGKFFNIPYKLGKGSTVAELGLAFALMFGCKTIFLQGIDIPTYQSSVKQLGINNKVKSKVGITLLYPTLKNIKGDILEKETNKILRKKYFFYYVKNLNFKPYLQSLKERIQRLIFSTTPFGLNIKNTFNIFNWLGKIAVKNKSKVYVLSKNSNLLKLINFHPIDLDELKVKYKKYFTNS